MLLLGTITLLAVLSIIKPFPFHFKSSFYQKNLWNFRISQKLSFSILSIRYPIPI